MDIVNVDYAKHEHYRLEDLAYGDIFSRFNDDSFYMKIYNPDMTMSQDKCAVNIKSGGIVIMYEKTPVKYYKAKVSLKEQLPLIKR